MFSGETSVPLRQASKKTVHTVRGNGELAPSIDAEHAEKAQRPTHDVAF
jgi:hypothetical protein